MPRKMSVWANCSLKMSDLELESWLLRGVLSVGNSLGVIGGEASALPFCVPVSQLGMDRGFIHLNTPAASKSWAGDKGKWSESAKSELCSRLRCGEEWGSLFISCCFYSSLVHHLSFLLPAFLCKRRVSFVIQLNPHIRLAKTPCAF